MRCCLLGGAIGVMALCGPVLGQRLWVEKPGVMILPDRPAGSATSVELTGARSEFLSFQVGLRADQPAEGLAFEWTGLKGSGGKDLSKANVRLFRAADIDVTKAARSNPADPPRARPAGKFPDALVPLVGLDGANVANTIKLEKDTTLSFWADVFLPADAPAGSYTGHIDLKSAAVVVTGIDLTVTVLDVTIPADSSIPSLYNLRAHEHVSANLDNYVRETLRHRLQPTNYHYLDMVPNPRYGWAYLDRYNPDGRGYVSVMVPDAAKPAPDKQTELIAQLKDIQDHLKQRELFERTYLQLKDEPDKRDLAGIAEVAKVIVDALPEYKDKLTDTLNHEKNELDDVIVHHVRCLNFYGKWWRDMDGRPEWDRRRARGQQLWFYVSNAQSVPYPTLDVNTPNLGFEPRVLGWAWWYEKAYGHLYWDLMHLPGWQLNPRFPPGDGQLMYPGDLSLPGAPSWVLVKDIHEPVVSRRMKLMRQGIQEWELLKMAERQAGRERVAPIVERVYSCLGKRTWPPYAYDPTKPMWSYTEADWDVARTAVLELLARK